VRIAVVAPVWIPVPPPGYGGVEQVVSLLIEELVARGHDVTLFASGDSVTKANLRSVYDEAPTDRLWEVEPDAVHVGAAYTFATRAFRDGEGFDLVHDHTNYLGVAFAASLPTPVVHTVHMVLDQARASFLRRFSSEVYLTAISAYQRDEVPELPWRGVVHNAVDLDALPFRGDKEGYLLCIGRVCERKGQDLAIEVARQAGLPLVLAGRVHPKEAWFFEERILPYVDADQVVFHGEVSNELKGELLAGARALLFPVREPEPFGLAMVEALGCGTPVIAEPLGAVPEVVTDGETGFLAAGVDAMADAVERTPEISPERCREEAVARFHPQAMVDGYEAVYRGILGEL
jgi:glycosyltransferase involved in cell wall biosynthesis